MWSVSNRTGTSNSKSDVTDTPHFSAVENVTTPVATSTDHPESSFDAVLVERTVPATGLVMVRASITLPDA